MYYLFHMFIHHPLLSVGARCCAFLCVITHIVISLPLHVSVFVFNFKDLKHFQIDNGVYITIVI